MPEYRFNVLDDGGVIASSHTYVDFPDDRTALAGAGRMLLDTREIEVWCGSRNVGRISLKTMGDKMVELEL